MSRVSCAECAQPCPGVYFSLDCECPYPGHLCPGCVDSFVQTGRDRCPSCHSIFRAAWVGSVEPGEHQINDLIAIEQTLHDTRRVSPGSVVPIVHWDAATTQTINQPRHRPACRSSLSKSTLLSALGWFGVIAWGAQYAAAPGALVNTTVAFAAYACLCIAQTARVLCLRSASLESQRCQDVLGWIFAKSAHWVLFGSSAVAAAWGWWRDWSESLIIVAGLDLAYMIISLLCSRCILR